MSILLKKTLTVIIAAALVMFSFVGCSAKTMKSGSYRAEFTKADSHGWTDYVVVTVKDDKISEVDYDSVNAEGEKKSENVAYNDAMKGAGSATWPADFMPKIEKSLIEKQKASEVDTIAGATESSKAFKELASKLKTPMEKGETSTIKVENVAK